MLLINIAGAAALLLWAVRMVRTGVDRANGRALRKAVKRSGQNRLKAAAIGTSVALLLQSSTAVAMLATGFAATGILSIPHGIALLLGADLGSALVVQLLSFDLGWLMPFLLTAGVALFLKGTNSTIRQAGRVLIGIGLILLSLRLIGEATAPLRASEFMLEAVGYLENDMITAVLIGAMVTWLLHSSVASILLIATLVAQSVLSPMVGIGLVLGANIGSGLIAFGLTSQHEPNARRIPLGNLLFRSIGVLVVLVLLKLFPVSFPSSASLAASWMIYAHVVFNLALLLSCLPLVGAMAATLARVGPKNIDSGPLFDPLRDRKSALDRTALPVPQLALASATRECLRMSDIVEPMLTPIMALYENADKRLVEDIKELQKTVSSLHSDIKLYLAELSEENLSEREQRRKHELINFAINMDAVSELATKNLVRLATNMNNKGLAFSNQGRIELKDLHKQVMDNMHLALNVLVSGDITSARQLVEEKDRLRDLERSSNVRHLRRLQTGYIESIETSDIHLETLRSLRQINSLFAAVAYPILSTNGELLNSRLARAQNS